MTLTLSQLRAELDRLNAHGLADTNVLSVDMEGGNVAFAFDESSLRGEVSSLTDDVKSLEAELKTAEEDCATAKDAAEKAEALLAEVKEEGEAGATLKQYREQAEQAMGLMRQWRDAAQKAELELTALRKKKGVGANCVKHARDIMTVLDAVAYPQNTVRGLEAPEMASKLLTVLRA